MNYVIYIYIYKQENINKRSNVYCVCHWHNPSGRKFGPEIYSASNRNEYMEYLLGVKAAGA